MSSPSSLCSSDSKVKVFDLLSRSLFFMLIDFVFFFLKNFIICYPSSIPLVVFSPLFVLFESQVLSYLLTFTFALMRTPLGMISKNTLSLLHFLCSLDQHSDRYSTKISRNDVNLIVLFDLPGQVVRYFWKS